MDERLPEMFVDPTSPGVIRYVEDPMAGMLAGMRAKQIVTACNCHQDLLAACKALDAALCDGFDTKAQRTAGRKALIAARAAIAKAEK